MSAPAPEGKLTTHVLDTAQGKPAARMAFVLLCHTDAGPTELLDGATNADGRVDGPLLHGDALKPGVYELRFDVAGYFKRCGHADAGKFLRAVPLVFHVDDEKAHYHVPLLVSPWSYSTYRGS